MGTAKLQACESQVFETNLATIDHPVFETNLVIVLKEIFLFSFIIKNACTHFFFSFCFLEARVFHFPQIRALHGTFQFLQRTFHFKLWKILFRVLSIASKLYEVLSHHGVSK